MIASWWFRRAGMRAFVAATRSVRTQLAVHPLEDRNTPAKIFAIGSAPDAASLVAIYDAATRQQQFSVSPFPGFTGGVNVALGDVNGDGTPDVITGAGTGGGPVVNVYSGTDGILLRAFTVGDADSRAGASVAAADFDQDGLSELVVGTIRGGQPLVQVLRFSDGSVLHGYTPFEGSNGVSVAAGDVTGDGRPDVIVGAGPGGGPRVMAFDGRSAAVVQNFYAFETTFIGGVTVSVGDLDSDGRADVAVAAEFLGGPRVQAFSGLNGQPILNFFAYDSTLRGGVRASVVDVDGNGSLDLVTTNGRGQSQDPKAFDPRSLSQLSASPPPGLATGTAYDMTAPTAAITMAATGPTRTVPIVFTVAFSEAVNGFLSAGLTAANGSVATFTRVDAKTYTAEVAPVAEGIVTLTVAAGVATDAAGNRNTASDSVSRTFDTTAPVVTASPLTTNDATPSLTGTVGESGSSVTVSIGGQTIPAAVSGTAWTAVVPAALAEGAYTITVSATDLAGNVGSGATADGLLIDLTAPTAMVGTTAPDPANASPIPFTVTFSEVVTGFAAADVTVGNGAVFGFAAVDARTFTFGVVPAAAGTVSVSVAPGAAADLAGNVTRASNTVTREFTGTVATPTVSTTASSPTNLALIPFTVSFDDDVTGFELFDIAVTNGTAANFAAVDARTYTFDVTPTADGTVTVAVPAAAAVGPGGAPTAAGSASIVSDRTAPAAALATTAADPTNLATLPFTLTFSEDVTGVGAADLTVTNGTPANFVAVGARTYTFDVTLTADGPISVTAAADAGRDAAGNASLAASLTVTSDRTAPTVAVTTTAADPTDLAVIPFTSTFSEGVTGFTAAGVTAANGTVSNFMAVSPTTYTFDVTPAGDGPVAVAVAAGAAQDAAGNANTAGSLTVTSERMAPTAVIFSTAADPTNLAFIPITVTFSEDVTGFDETDPAVTNGIVSNFVSVSPRVYTFEVTPAADGPVTVDLPVGAAQDAVGNPGEAATFGITSDRSAPAAPVVIGLDMGSDSGTAGDGLTNGTAPTLVGTAEAGATVQVFADGGSGSVSLGTTTAGTRGDWSLTPTAPLADSTYAVTAVATDPAGNVSPVSTAFTLTVDTTAPAASLTTTVWDPANLSVIPFTLAFDEDAAGFDQSGLTVANGTLSNFSPVDARTFTFDVTPAADGAVSVTVAAGAASDAAGNASEAVTRSVASDRTAPAGAVAGTSPTAADPIAFTVSFDEDVIGLDTTGVTVTNGTLGVVTQVDARTFTVEVRPTADGAVALTVAAGAAADAAGNGNATFAGAVTSDRSAPATVLTTTATDLTNAATLSFTVTFSEDVTGFDLSGVQVTNSTASSLVVVNAQTYTFEVTPAADGPVGVGVSAGAAADAAGNASTASVTVTVTSDRTPPTATIDPTPTAAVTGIAADATTGVAGVAVSIFDGTYYWDGTAFASPTEVFLDATSTDGFATWSYAVPDPGTYIVRARATDLAGNESFGAAEVTVG